MPIQVFLALLILVTFLAGATIALIWALGFSFAWIGLAALILALVIRRVSP